MISTLFMTFLKQITQNIINRNMTTLQRFREDDSQFHENVRCFDEDVTKFENYIVKLAQAITEI